MGSQLAVVGAYIVIFYLKFLEQIRKLLGKKDKPEYGQDMVFIRPEEQKASKFFN